MARWLLVLSLLLSAVCEAQYAPLAIDFEAPDYTAGTPYTNFLQYELPYLSGIAPGSSPNGLGTGQIYWADLDNCSSSGPCVADNMPPCSSMGTNCYNWAAIDADMMNYIGQNVGTSGKKFYNGCANGKSCKFILIINAEQDSGQGVTSVPTYVFLQSWANTAGGCTGGTNCALQDVAACEDWPGIQTGPHGVWPGPLPYTGSFTTKDQGIVWNEGNCVVPTNSSGGPACNSPPFTNMSGFPVVYENPILTAYQQLISAIRIHYSPQGLGNGPTIAPYIAYIRIGMAAGGENNPGCVAGIHSGVSNGILSNTFWPGPRGLGSPSLPLEPQCFTQCGYLTNWAGTLQNGLSCGQPCSSLSSDGDGYVTKMDKFLGPLFAGSGNIPVTTSAHGGPPGDTQQPYANAEAVAASLEGVGFGMQAASISDQLAYAVGEPTLQNWVINFASYGAPVHHLQAEANGGANPESANFSIITNGITCIGTICTVNCTGSISNNCGIYNGATVQIVGNSNNSYNGPQSVTGSSTLSSFTFTPFDSDSSGGSGGSVYAPDYWPSLFPFLTQQRTSSIELRACELDYAFGCGAPGNACTTNTGPSTLPCGGNTGPDPSYQAALANFVNGIPTATSSVSGGGQIITNGVIQ